MHKRSRSGCFTCRLRRKKCDETKPSCIACSKLSIRCEYKRPFWWGNAEQRNLQKELIKTQIKNMKIAEKQAAAALASQQQHQMPLPANTPPSLYHSPSDGFCRTRGGSIESSEPDEFDFNSLPPTADMYAHSMSSCAPVQLAMIPLFQPLPYNETVTIETEWSVNDVASRKDSTISTTCFESLPPSKDQPMTESWVQNSTLEHHQELLNDALEFSVFDVPGSLSTTPAASSLAGSPPISSCSPAIPIEQRDDYLRFHFSTVIVSMAFPMLKLSDPVKHSQLLLVPLDTNQAYYHAALSYAASHLKTTTGFNTTLEEDLIRHVTHTIQVITSWLTGEDSAKYTQVAETSLAMIYLRGLVGGQGKDMCDLPWESHWKAAQDTLLRLSDDQRQTYMPVAGWVDILGSTMVGSKPAFADAYREHIINGTSIGFRNLLGCDDAILYLISEISCLDNFKRDAIVDDISLCFHIKNLGDHISANERVAAANLPPSPPPSSHSSPCPSQCPSPAPSHLSQDPNKPSDAVSHHISVVFRCAARIYLCSLLPDFDPSQPNIQSLVETLGAALAQIPSTFDHALVWPLLQAGAVTSPRCSLRAAIGARATTDVVAMGSLGRLAALLAELWKVNDARVVDGERPLPWRTVMEQNKWDFLLI